MTKFKYLKILILVSLFSLPIKLSWLYICLTPAILWFLYLIFKKEIKIKKEILDTYFPLSAFFITLILSSFFGINQGEALIDSLKALLYSVSPLIFYYVLKENKRENLEFALALGFSFICIKTLSSYSSIFYLKNFATSISQSGQLAIALTFFILYKLETTTFKELKLKSTLMASAVFISSLAIVLTPIMTLKLTALIALLIISFITLKNNDKDKFIYLITTPLMLALLLLNLKRGPIIGLIVSSLCYSLLFKRKLSIFIIALSLTLFFFVPQLQDRTLASLEHFFIKGGRYEIWSVAYELIGRYPLGLGFSSSEFLQNFSLDIPLNLKHFHNNFLNILIECGWIPLLLLIWFYIKLAIFAFKNNKNYVAIPALFSILTMQIAGIFEYNFGDSEVLLVSYFFVGLIFYSAETKTIK